jgi:hypothetical protein
MLNTMGIDITTPPHLIHPRYQAPTSLIFAASWCTQTLGWRASVLWPGRGPRQRPATDAARGATWGGGSRTPREARPLGARPPGAGQAGPNSGPTADATGGVTPRSAATGRRPSRPQQCDRRARGRCDRQAQHRPSRVGALVLECSCVLWILIETNL